MSQSYQNYILNRYSIGLLVAVLIFFGYKINKGQKYNESLTDYDIANYTSELGARSDCYFENITVIRNPDRTIKTLQVLEPGFDIKATPIINNSTQKLVGFKVSRPQIMYCTKGIRNYKTSVIIIDRILNELTVSERAIKAEKLKKDNAFKNIDKIGKYYLKY